MYVVIFLSLLMTACHNHNNNSVTSVAENTKNKTQTDLTKQTDIESKRLPASQNYIYLHETVSSEHERAINILLDIYYSGDDAKRNNTYVIQQILNDVYPVEKTTDITKQYRNLEYQTFALLNFEVDSDGYQIRRKSDLMRLMYEFKIKVYEDRLHTSFKDNEIKTLFEREIIAWNNYFKTTSNAFEKFVLFKEFSHFKNIVWNNYDFDVMKQRYYSLVAIYLNNLSIWNIDNVCEWNEVKSGYQQLYRQLITDSDNDFSHQGKMEALRADESTFKEFLNIHKSFTHKLGFNDEGHILRSKKTIISNLFVEYDSDKAIEQFCTKKQHP